MTTLAASAPAQVRTRALGTYVHLLVTDHDAVTVAQRLLEDGLAALDAACSRFRPDGEILQVERAAGNPVRVSAVLADAVGVALRAAELTSGDLDPTIGTAMCAIGYDRDFASVRLDGPAAVSVRRAEARWCDVRLDPVQRMLTVPAGTRLDLGATAKAWAADTTAAQIAAATGSGVLVNLGGDISVAGTPPEDGWSIGIHDRAADGTDPTPGAMPVVAIASGGFATSSTTSRRWRRGGDVMHHIVDPRSGMPAPPVWRMVSVAAGSCLDANIASTTAVIRGLGAFGWLDQLGLPARLVDGDGRVHVVGGWPEDVS